MQHTMIRNTNKLVYMSANIFPRQSEKKTFVIFLRLRGKRKLLLTLKQDPKHTTVRLKQTT